MCTDKECQGLVKPDIVFFGEGLPKRFHELIKTDFPQADLLIVMGTSLQVQPFASLIDNVPRSCVRLLVNREPAGVSDPDLLERLEELSRSEEPTVRAAVQQFLATRMQGFDFTSERNDRDIFLEGECDDGVRKLARLIGQEWEHGLEKLLGNIESGENSKGSGNDSVPVS